jgi:hypothetical protein
MIYTGNLVFNEFQTTMKEEFEMTDLSLMKYFLSIEVEQYAQGIFIFQNKYATNILKRFKMDKWKPTRYTNCNRYKVKQT